MRHTGKAFAMFLALMMLISTVACAEGMGLQDIVNANRVKYIADWEFFYYQNQDCYVVLFSLKDKNGKRIAAPANAKVEIINELGKTIFSEERQLTREDFFEWTSKNGGTELLASMAILKEKIKVGDKKNGTVHLTVWLDGYYSFRTIEFETNALPTVPIEEKYRIALPDVPKELTQTIDWKDTVVTKVKVTNVQYKVKEWLNDKVVIDIYFTGEKTYDYKGEGNSDSCAIGWKLYDKEGYVVKTGAALTQDVMLGEKFKDCDITLYDLEPGEYRLELTDVN